MTFYINNVKIRIEYSLFLIIAFSLMIKNENILYVILFSSVHELAHLSVLIIAGGKPSEINAAFYGIGLKYRCNLSFIAELLFLLSGAAINLLLCALNICREINFSLALINLLPLYPLDGGRAAKLILNEFFSLNVSDRIFKAISLIFITVLISFSILTKNVSLILISIYVLFFSLNNSFE